MKNKIILETKKYRIVEIQDEYMELDSLKGDSFNPEVNSDLDPIELKKQETEFEILVENEGVFGYELEKKCHACGAWEHVDSCYGFVGRYSESDEKFKHYIVDELKNTGEKLK